LFKAAYSIKTTINLLRLGRGGTRPFLLVKFGIWLSHPYDFNHEDHEGKNKLKISSSLPFVVNMIFSMPAGVG
jgi:hypothetical protein